MEVGGLSLETKILPSCRPFMLDWGLKENLHKNICEKCSTSRKKAMNMARIF